VPGDSCGERIGYGHMLPERVNEESSTIRKPGHLSLWLERGQEAGPLPGDSCVTNPVRRRRRQARP